METSKGAALLDDVGVRVLARHVFDGDLADAEPGHLDLADGIRKGRHALTLASSPAALLRAPDVWLHEDVEDAATELLDASADDGDGVLRADVMGAVSCGNAARARAPSEDSIGAGGEDHDLSTLLAVMLATERQVARLDEPTNASVACVHRVSIRPAGRRVHAEKLGGEMLDRHSASGLDEAKDSEVPRRQRDRGLCGCGSRRCHLLYEVRTPADLCVAGITTRGLGLERLALYGIGQQAITADDVREVVMAASDAADFGIANAISRNDPATAIRELHLALDGGAAPFFLLGQLRTAAERLPPRRLKGGIEAVFRTDLALKSSGGDPRVLLERLVVELCESRARRPASS